MKKRKTKERISYPIEIYQKIPINHLIVFGIHSVLQRKEKCTFEKLIEECFNLFPEAFSFSTHPEWPDSLKFDRALRTLREKALIIGSPKSFFSLTKFGELVAKNTAKILKARLPKKAAIKRPIRDPGINWINTLKKSDLFKRFLKEGKKFSITEMELRNLMRCTLETPSRIVNQNFAYSINLAKEFKQKKLVEFLDFCQKKLSKK